MESKNTHLLRSRYSWIFAGIAYFACVSATITQTRFEGGVAFLWVGTAFLTAWLSTLPYRAWPASLVACGVASATATALLGFGSAAALPVAIVNLAEAALATVILRRWLGHHLYFDSMGGIAAFVLVAGLILPALMSIPAAAIAHAVTGTGFWGNMLNWFAGHALGTIAFTPIILLFLRRRVSPDRRWTSGLQRLEAAGLFALVAVVTFCVFDQTRLPLLFLPMLPMMVATVRLGRLGAATSTVILTVIGAILTIRDNGPIHLVQASDGVRVQFFQFYIATASMLVLPLAAMLKQRETLATRLSQSEAKYRLIAERSSDAIFTLAIDGTIIYASPAVRELGGFDPAEMIGWNARDLVIEEDVAKVVDVHRCALMKPDKAFSVEYRARTASGDLTWFETNTRAVVDENGAATGVVNAIRDISARKATEQRLSKAANTDPLTGLLNRRGFMNALEQRAGQVRDGEGRCAVAIFDLDRFKAVNDTHGHAAGDLVLQGFATIARRVLRDVDAIGRIGGEEFAVMLWDADADAAMMVCERLRAAVAAAPVRLPSGVALIVTASAGLSPLHAGSTASDALEAADRALYRAKAAGRNRLKLAA